MNDCVGEASSNLMDWGLNWGLDWDWMSHKRLGAVNRQS
jgi:hypothetical protein